MAPTAGKILPLELEEEMRRSYIDYAMSVIVGRALPDVRDGLKPVQRRILYAMYEAGMTPDRPHKKSARVVGDVLARYHPHGDAAVYESMVRMAQEFATRYPLVDGHGNFGSVDGDSPAAMRYTEARLSALAMEMLRDIEKETVDFIPNYDGSLQEPVVLPARVPNLLINGSAGIAVGMATNIPPHNLGEIVQALVALIDHPDLPDTELFRLVPGPDFPTGGVIVGRQGVEQAYREGRGSIRIRARVKLETEGGRPRLVVTEIPYQVNKAALVERIAELVREKKIEGVTELRDESDRTGLRVVLELRRDANTRVLLNQLFKHTQMEETFGAILLALVDGQPRLLSLRELLQLYLAHQEEIVRRRSQYELRKAEERAHIVVGLRIALQNLDAVIRLIRQSRDGETARRGLMERFGLTEVQAQAILDMRLQRLTALEREKLEAEYAELVRAIERLKQILADPALVRGLVREELLAVRERFADERRTTILEAEEELKEEDLIPEEEVAVIITRRGYAKRLPLSAYRSQRRGGRGVTGITVREQDVVEHFFVCPTHAYLLFFTDAGRVYRLKVYEIPEAGRQARGLPLVNLLPVEGARITAIVPVREFSAGYLFMATAQGTVKRTPLEEFASSRREGITALSLEEGDALVGVEITGGGDEVMLVSEQGLAIRFPEDEVRSMGRIARGVKGMDLAPEDRVVALVRPQPGKDLLVVTEDGYGKRTELAAYRRQGRGGRGILTLRADRRQGRVVAARVVDGEDEVFLISGEGEVIRLAAAEIPRRSRTAQGVTLMRLAPEDRVAAVAVVAGGD
ncbi:MAG: DNA gyrase subunit A [Moorellales bacterium]